MNFLENKWLQKTLVLVFALSAGYIIYSKTQSLDQWPVFLKGYQPLEIALFFAVLFSLTLLNWLFDSWGWHLITKPFRNQSWGMAWRENLSSQGLGWLTPAALGEYYAKGKGFESKKTGMALTLLFRWNKLGAKTILGLLALGLATNSNLLIIAGLLGLGLLLFLPKPMYSWGLQKIENFNFTQTSAHLQRDIAWWKLALSGILKSSVYALQFTWVALWILAPELHPNIEWELLAYGMAFFGLSGWIPSASWADPLIKSGLGILLIPETLLDPTQVVMVSIILWLVNVLIPTVPGLLTRGKTTLLK
ncbi:MAG: hypothetical protein SchgKO_11650 [Schleiferiaceae bacterium]